MISKEEGIVGARVKIIDKSTGLKTQLIIDLCNKNPIIESYDGDPWEENAHGAIIVNGFHFLAKDLVIVK